MFELPEKLKEGINEYEQALSAYLAGRIPEKTFKGTRVPWGIYSQRGGETFMVRIRVVGGRLTPRQASCVAALAERYGNGRVHLTTRQDIQLHGVKIEDTAAILQELAGKGLSPRGGGGNTLRNVIACPLSGVCKREVFDVSPFVDAACEYLLQQDKSFNMPRKLKVAFSGCPDDCARCAFADVGFIAYRENGTAFFKVLAGGGMGRDPRLGKVLIEHLKPEDVTRCIEAVMEVFLEKGDRKNRNRNRLRFLVERIGYEEFRRLWQEKFDSLRTPPAGTVPAETYPSRPEVNEEIRADHPLWDEFRRYNLVEQKQGGRFTLLLRISCGEMEARLLSDLAAFAAEHEAGMRTTLRQNIALTDLTADAVPRFLDTFSEEVKDFLYPDTLLDVTACKGSLTCNLGLCNPPALAKEIEKMVRDRFTAGKVFKALRFHLNGCPNACGGHPLAHIGLAGTVKRAGGRPVPCYRISVGGVVEGERSRLARECTVVPAKAVPSFLEAFLEEIEAASQVRPPEEFLCTEGPSLAARLAERFEETPSFDSSPETYVDWGRTEPFSLSGLGPGECGAGVLDMIEGDIESARTALKKAETAREPQERAKLLLETVFSASRALLVTRGKEAYTPEDAAACFVEEFVEKGLAESNLRTMTETVESLRKGTVPGGATETARRLLEEVERLYGGMDSSFTFPGERTGKEESKEKEVTHMDLRGTPCPINYVKVKLKLEQMPKESLLEVLLDEGEPVENVPRSLQNDGQEILSVERDGPSYRVRIRKKA